MSSLLKTKPFRGLTDESKDPEEYLGDVQAVAEGWHMSGSTRAAVSAVLQKAIIRFFRQNLVDVYDAAWWW